MSLMMNENMKFSQQHFISLSTDDKVPQHAVHYSPVVFRLWYIFLNIAGFVVQEKQQDCQAFSHWISELEGSVQDQTYSTYCIIGTLSALTLFIRLLLYKDGHLRKYFFRPYRGTQIRSVGFSSVNRTTQCWYTLVHFRGKKVIQGVLSFLKGATS